jgi:hypothetical protein
MGGVETKLVAGFRGNVFFSIQGRCCSPRYLGKNEWEVHQMKLNHDPKRRFSYRWPFGLILVLLSLFWGDEAISQNSSQGNSSSTYVGSLVCQKCHPEEYANFMAYAKKSTSFRSIEKQMRHLTHEEIKKCYPCHTTGYGRPGGFVSPEKTPNLKNAGCEVCHGSGAEHSRTKDAKDIKGSLSKKDCEQCHISERVKAFKYKPLIHGGAH